MNDASHEKCILGKSQRTNTYARVILCVCVCEETEHEEQSKHMQNQDRHFS